MILSRFYRENSLTSEPCRVSAGESARGNDVIGDPW